MKTHLSLSLIITAAIFYCTVAEAANGYKAVQDFDCTYVSKAFEDESAFRKTLSPPPDPRALVTVQTREVAHFVGGYLTAWNAMMSSFDRRAEPYDVYPSGLFPALNHIQSYCSKNPAKKLTDGLLDLLKSKDANPVQRQ